MAAEGSTAEPVRYFRKVIRISAYDSPHVELGLLQEDRGQPIVPHYLLCDPPLYPNVIDYEEFKKRKATFSKIRYTVGVLGQFYEGAELLMFPLDWMDLSHAYHAERVKLKTWKARKFLGVDVGGGGDETAWAVVDELGVIHGEAYQTPDTSVIAPRTRELMKIYGINPRDVLIDFGGGGQFVGQAMQAAGIRVRLQTFNAAPGYPQDEDASAWADDRHEAHLVELKATYKNRRAQMYDQLSKLLDPTRFDAIQKVAGVVQGEVLPAPYQAEYDGRLSRPEPFAIPGGEEYRELCRQLEPIPRLTNGEGQQYLPSKKKNKDTSTERTMRELIGCSPDRADALVLAVHLMLGAAVGSRDGVVMSAAMRAAGKKPEVKGESMGPYKNVHFPKPGERLVLKDFPAPALNGNGKH